MNTTTYAYGIYNGNTFDNFTITGKAGATYVTRVQAENGDIVEKLTDSIQAAKASLNYYLKKYDKLHLGASGSYYKLVAAVAAAA